MINLIILKLRICTYQKHLEIKRQVTNTLYSVTKLTIDWYFLKLLCIKKNFKENMAWDMKSILERNVCSTNIWRDSHHFWFLCIMFISNFGRGLFYHFIIYGNVQIIFGWFVPWRVNKTSCKTICAWYFLGGKINTVLISLLVTGIFTELYFLSNWISFF